MATGLVFDVEFQVVKAKSGKFEGRATSYRLDARKAQVYAANAAGCQAVLNANITLGSGETVEILHIKNNSLGGEGTVYS